MLCDAGLDNIPEAFASYLLNSINCSLEQITQLLTKEKGKCFVAQPNQFSLVLANLVGRSDGDLTPEAALLSMIHK